MSAYRIIHGARLDNDQAREFVYTLSQEERSCLLVELNSFNNSKYSGNIFKAPSDFASFNDIRRVILSAICQKNTSWQIQKQSQ